jgi:hypothetical protein
MRGCLWGFFSFSFWAARRVVVRLEVVLRSSDLCDHRSRSSAVHRDRYQTPREPSSTSPPFNPSRSDLPHYGRSRYSPSDPGSNQPHSFPLQPNSLGLFEVRDGHDDRFGIIFRVDRRSLERVKGVDDQVSETFHFHVHREFKGVEEGLADIKCGLIRGGGGNRKVTGFETIAFYSVHGMILPTIACLLSLILRAASPRSVSGRPVRNQRRTVGLELIYCCLVDGVDRRCMISLCIV